jgi:ribose 5-phosphate isomerase RpiB
MLVLGASYVKKNTARAILSVWLKTNALGERHARRVRQIKRIEAKVFK